MASILDQLDELGNEHPHKLLYSFLDLNGNTLECYSYASFIERTKAIAGHLLKDCHFAPEDRLLLAYPPGLEMICAFFGCVALASFRSRFIRQVLAVSRARYTKWSTSPRIARLPAF